MFCILRVAPRTGVDVSSLVLSHVILVVSLYVRTGSFHFVGWKRHQFVTGRCLITVILAKPVHRKRHGCCKTETDAPCFLQNKNTRMIRYRAASDESIKWFVIIRALCICVLQLLSWRRGLHGHSAFACGSAL